MRGEACVASMAKSGCFSGASQSISRGTSDAQTQRTLERLAYFSCRTVPNSSKALTRSDAPAPLSLYLISLYEAREECHTHGIAFFVMIVNNERITDEHTSHVPFTQQCVFRRVPLVCCGMLWYMCRHASASFCSGVSASRA